MRATLAQEQTLSELAAFLYDFLPGDPHPYADQTISFRGAAHTTGVGSFWHGGSKQPAIASLLRSTFEQRQNRLCDLIVEIVRKGIAYRQKKGPPITREEIQSLNDLVKELGFKIPELNDPKFLDRLPRAAPPDDANLSPECRLRLADQLVKLTAMSPQPRGYAFEKFIKDVFAIHEMAPRDSFRLIGEQIDGSFHLQGQTYLVEATWRNAQIGQEELLAFHGKVIGKAEWSRGLHISYAGYTREGLEAFRQGCSKRGLSFRAVVDKKARRAAETNYAFVPVRELFP